MGDAAKLRSVTIHLGDQEGKIEEILPEKEGSVKIRIYGWSLDHTHSQPLELTENELVDILQMAVRAGIISPEFVKNFCSEFEI
ncbi:MAG: hypothetical protein ABFD44_00330 [Anaerolineaceae bacterium]